ncbi:PDZ domain-containing protein [Anatilimnocola sp. NA78]|uniref:PDZ domain-containing protein n=1 Tax=Anatilimnocola sp. NA78 TaxID=3415683 RepID=UPI003CE47B8A
MSISLSNWLKTLSAAVPAALLSAALAASPAYAQNTAPPPAVPAPAKDVRDAAKDTVKETREAARDNAKEVRDQANDKVRDTREAVRDTRDAARDAQSTVKDPRDPKDPARDLSRDARDPRNTREAIRETTDTVRDAARDIRDTARDTARSARDVRASFRAEGTRAADFGLWFSRGSSNGLVISDVSTRGAIAKFGFREGDRIVSVNGRRVATEADFVTYLFAEDVRDQDVKVIVVRDGREEVIVIQPVVFIDEVAYVDNDPLENFGIVLDDRHTDRVVVWRVLPRSPAYYSGIRAGDVIVSLGDQRVTGVQGLVQRLSGIDAGNVQVQVSRGEATRTYEVDVPRFAARTERRAALRPNFDAEERRDDRLDRREDRVDDRRDNRTDRIEDRRETRPAPVPTPRVEGAVPVPAPVPAPAVNPPGVSPATPVPAPAAPAPAPGNPPARPGLFPRVR